MTPEQQKQLLENANSLIWDAIFEGGINDAFLDKFRALGESISQALSDAKKK